MLSYFKIKGKRYGHNHGQKKLEEKEEQRIRKIAFVRGDERREERDKIKPNQSDLLDQILSTVKIKQW